MSCRHLTCADFLSARRQKCRPVSGLLGCLFVGMQLASQGGIPYACCRYEIVSGRCILEKIELVHIGLQCTNEDLNQEVL